MLPMWSARWYLTFASSADPRVSISVPKYFPAPGLLGLLHLDGDFQASVELGFFVVAVVVCLWPGSVLHCCVGFPLVAVSEGLSLVAMCRLRLAAASLGAEHRLSGTEAQWVQHVGPGVVAHGLSCSTACGIFLYQGLNPRLLRRQKESLPLDHQ